MTDYTISEDKLCQLLEAAYVQGHNDCKTIDSEYASSFEFECDVMINNVIAQLKVGAQK